MTRICLISFYKFEFGNNTTVSKLSVRQSNRHPLGAVDDPTNCCPRPARQQFIGSSTVPRGDSLDCCTERYEIVVCRGQLITLLPEGNSALTCLRYRVA